MSNLASNENEEMALIHLAGFLIPVVLAGAGAWIAAQSTVAAAWLISHNLVVEPANALIPLTDNAGLDLVRIVAILAIASTIGFAIVRLKPRKKNTAARS